MVQPSENGPNVVYFYVPETGSQNVGWLLHKFICLPTNVLIWIPCPYARVIGGEIGWRQVYSLWEIWRLTYLPVSQFQYLTNHKASSSEASTFSQSLFVTTESPYTNLIWDIFFKHLNILRQKNDSGCIYIGEEMRYKPWGNRLKAMYISITRGAPRRALSYIRYLIKKMSCLPNYFLQWIYLEYSWVPAGKVWFCWCLGVKRYRASTFSKSAVYCI